MHQKQTERINIAPSAYVTVTDMGHLLEMQHMEKRNSSCAIRKLDRDRYVFLETGEIMEFEKTNDRSENANSLGKTFKKLRYLINNNFTGKPNELFLTLTYRGELQTSDTKRVYLDFNKFMKRLKYQYRDVSTIDYINVIEPHASGNFHMHVLLRFNELDKIYIPNDVDRLTGVSINAPMRDIWGNGNVSMKSLKNIDNIGAYLSAYLSDIEIPDDHDVGNRSDVVVKEVKGKEKKFIKGGRLAFYPTGVNIYRKSKGIVYPERKEMTYAQIKKIVGPVEPHYSKSYTVERDDFKNTITYEQYNLKRE